MKLLERHADDQLVAFGDDGSKTCRDLRVDAAKVAQALPPATYRSQVLVAFERDRYAFAASLLGAWSVGHSVALAPNTRRDTVFEVSQREDVVVTLHDTDSHAAIQVPRLLGQEESSAPVLSSTLPSGRDVLLTVFTSGTTQAISAWPKTESQIFEEVDTLVSTFSVEPGSRVVATVGPGHIYGLLFSVLVPLQSGGSFLRDTPFHAEAVANRVHRFEAQTLVTVPAHIRPLAVVDAASLRTLSSVYCSTAPLSSSVARSFVHRHDVPLFEVLGSTETGGIAYRDRRSSDRFRPFAPVRIEANENGRLVVESPFVDPHAPRPFVTADLVQLDGEGGFHHRGRVDGIVKIGGRRESIPAMEDWLMQLDGVQDVAVVAVSSEHGRGQRLYAAIVADGWDGPSVREKMATRFESSCIPRRFVFVDVLPREDNGKLQRVRMMRLFGLNGEGQPLNFGFRWQAQEVTQDEEGLDARSTVSIDRDCAWFEGHFPKHPVLPGAVQLSELVLPFVRERCPDLGEVLGMSRLKFLAPIRPGTDVTVAVRRKFGSLALDFELRGEKQLYAAGRLRFAEASAQ